MKTFINSYRNKRKKLPTLKILNCALKNDVISSKKILVIVLMAVLASSVLAGTSSLFSGRRSPSPSNTQQVDINTQLNNIVDFCMQSLPNGIPECDNQLRDLVNSLCNDNRENLDACNDGRVNQYYKVRAEAAAESQ
jgi:hypothetical protein